MKWNDWSPIKARKAKYGFKAHINGDNIMGIGLLLDPIVGKPDIQRWYLELKSSGIYSWADITLYVNDIALGEKIKKLIEGKDAETVSPD